MKLLNKKKKQRTSTYNIKGCVFLILGYIRVSTVQQNTDRQFDALTEYGCEKLFIDKITNIMTNYFIILAYLVGVGYNYWRV